MDKINKINKSCAFRFNEIDSNFDIIPPDAIDTKGLEALKLSGQILDYEISHKGIMIIKEFKLNSVYI